MLELATQFLRIAVAPERGAEIRFLGQLGGSNVLAWYDWESPIRASDSVSYGSSSADWHSEYRGGWQVLFPNVGPECDVAGVRHPFHGEVSAATWRVVQRDEHAVEFECGTRASLVLTRHLRLAPDRATLFVKERVKNVGSTRARMQWGEHPAFGVETGTVIDLPPGEVHVDDGWTPECADLAPGTAGMWPRVPGVGGGEVDVSVVPPGPSERLLYLPSLRAGWSALRHPDGTGVAVSWDTETFPHLWLWQEIGGIDFPWYGRAHLVALEPQSSWPQTSLADCPNPLALAAGEDRETWMTLSLFECDDRRVVSVDASGTVARDGDSS